MREIAQASILHNLRRRGLELKDYGLSMGMSQKSGYNRYTNPDTLTVREIRLMHMSLTELKELTGIYE